MSFVGYLRPLAQARHDEGPAGRWPMATMAAGFATSAVLVTTSTHLLGKAVIAITHLGVPARAGIAAGALVACFVVNGDLFTFVPPMLRRQTPQRVFYMFGPIRGALVWGLDTGLMVTTYRITAATWATLSLCVLGFLPWWTGVIYATGFLLPVAIAVLIVPPRQGPPDSTVEPIWILDRISQHVHAVYRLASILLAASTAALIVVVVR